MKILRAFKYPPTHPSSLALLKKALGDGFPALVDLYRQMDGFELQLEPDYTSDDLLLQLDCLRIDHADYLVGMLSHYSENFPGVLVIGSDAATNLIALDCRGVSDADADEVEEADGRAASTSASSLDIKAPLVVFRADEEPYLHTCRIIAGSFAGFCLNDEVQEALRTAEVWG